VLPELGCAPLCPHRDESHTGQSPAKSTGMSPASCPVCVTDPPVPHSLRDSPSAVLLPQTFRAPGPSARGRAFQRLRRTSFPGSLAAPLKPPLLLWESTGLAAVQQLAESVPASCQPCHSDHNL